MKRIVRTFLLLAPVAAGAVIWACTNDTAPKEPAGVEQLRASLAPYSSLALAKTAGYAIALTDCMSNGDEGAMGVHWAKPALIDAVADSLYPEALIYEPGTNGEASLVGVEFIVPYAAVARSATPPRLFNQDFVRNDVFQVWALHVWTHRANPSGVFASWNPRVHC